MRILVLGAGAVGGYFGGRLVEAGGDVTFLVRERRAAELAANGLVIKSSYGDATLAVQTVTVGPALKPFDIILLACKAYDLASAIDSIAPAVGPESAVLPLLNGLSHLDALEARFGKDRVLGGVAQIGATLGANGRIEHLNRVHRVIFGERDGRRSPRVAALAELTARAKFDAALSEIILLEMWEKFVLLATLAGMTCLMRASVGAIMTTREGEALMSEFLAECNAVAVAAGQAPRAAFLERARVTLTTRGSDFTASMLRDIERGGPTEGDHILGDLLHRARALGVATPLLRVAACHVEAYEARRAAR
ncbi:MAG TPA: 2-dehydropantoate 2-reductase [Dongiaceae bacterium]|nr:2-dehydropantoate 2-reductase [Dongiaceae bacterium]